MMEELSGDVNQLALSHVNRKRGVKSSTPSTGFMKTKTTLLAFTQTTLLVLLLGACAGSGLAQSFDSSGDAKLNGTYYFRQVLYFESDDAGDLEDAMSVQGTITFNGAGSYTTNATLLDAEVSDVPQAFTGSGSYVISASGEGYISAVNQDFPGDQIVGLVSTEGVFIGSTTETQNSYNDLFVAAPVGSKATNATLSGSYQAAYYDASYPGDAQLTFTANGSGSIGTLNAYEFVGGDTTPTTQTLSGVTYSFSNGAAQLNFGGTVTDSNFIGGTDLLYITPDGNFIFGGNYNGFDMFVGVKNATSNPSNYQALYYQAGADLDLTGYPDDNYGLDSYYGATNIFSGGDIIADERDNCLTLYGGSSDYTYSDGYTPSVNDNGSANDSYYTYWTNPAGTIRIGYAEPSVTGFDTIGLNVAFQSPSFSGSGVYINPVGVENAASSAPFTAFLSPGEFVTLYGSGLADTTTATSVPFPDNPAGVTVTVNQVQAPVYYVSPTQISFVVPFITTQTVAEIQVSNNAKQSNIVTAFVGQTSVGVFTNTPVGGDGIAASERPDYSVVSESNPAQLGETVSVYVAGMGGVSSQPADGTAAPSSPLAYTNNTPIVYLTDTDGNTAQATVAFSGLAPGFAGLYQINFAIPSGLVTGLTLLDIFSGLDSENAESVLPITDTTSAAIPAARAGSGNKHARPHLKRRFKVSPHRSSGKTLRVVPVRITAPQE